MKKILKMYAVLVLSYSVLLGTGLAAPAAELETRETNLLTSPSDCSFDDDKDVKNKIQCYQYLLQKYGWQRKSVTGSSAIMTEEENTQNILDFQKFFKIPQTGVMDDETVKVLNADRCGVPDQKPNQTNTRRKKRFILNGSKWAASNLAWCIYDEDLSPDMSRDGQIKAMADALKMWADVSGLTFKQETDCRRADIQIKFAVRSHGDGDPFDGEHGTLAHAFFPRFGGDAHFDDDERWSLTSTSRGQKLFIPIATHEFGHSLGLGHTGDSSAMMYSVYRTFDPVMKLQQDDIDGIQYLYGQPIPQTPAPWTPRPQTPAPWTPRPQTPAPWTPRPWPTQAPWTQRPQTPAPWPTQAPWTWRPPTTTREPVGALCTGTVKLDAMVMLGNGFTWGFSRDTYWRMDTNSVVDQIPRPIGERWFYYENGQRRAMPGNLDAVLFWPNAACAPQCSGDTFFFQGINVYTLRDSDGTQGQVTKYLIRDLFQGLPDSIDAATLWTGNDKAYFFKGEQYWRVSNRNPPYQVDFVHWPYNFPRDIDQYWDLGWRSIDTAVYYWHYRYPEVKKTYFFKGEQYVRYNDANGEVDASYPKYTVINWYGCSQNIKSEMNMDDDEMIEDFDDTNVMDIEEIPTAMQLYPEEDEDTSSANLIRISQVTIIVYLSTLVLLSALQTWD